MQELELGIKRLGDICFSGFNSNNFTNSYFIYDIDYQPKDNGHTHNLFTN